MVIENFSFNYSDAIINFQEVLFPRSRFPVPLYPLKVLCSGFKVVVLRGFAGRPFIIQQIRPDSDYSHAEVKRRFTCSMGRVRISGRGRSPYTAGQWSSLSEFMRETKVNFTRFYNSRHGRRGYFRGDRFKFTDSGIIGTREYVRRTYRQVTDKFAAKREKIPRPISGLEGIYSLKRLTE
jgi:hypothetical protein